MDVQRKIAWASTVTTGVLASLPILGDWPGFDPSSLLARYSPSVAVLAATLVAVIWYATFTFESVKEAEARRLQDIERSARLVSSRLMSIRSHTLGLRRQMEFLHDEGRQLPVRPYVIDYVNTEIQRLQRQITKLSPAAAQTPIRVQAYSDAALFHLVSIRAGLLPLKAALESASADEVEPSTVTEQVKMTLEGLDEVVSYLREAIDSLATDEHPAGLETAAYVRQFGEAIKESAAVSDDAEGPNVREEGSVS